MFEARRPKKAAIIAGIPGVVRIQEVKRNYEITITNDELADERKYTIPYGYHIVVEDGMTVKAGQSLTEGSLYPQDVLDACGVEAVQDYIIAQVQSVYRTQGVDINDKHIEVIVRQMMKKYKILDAGDTDLLGGTLAERSRYYIENEKLQQRIAAGEPRPDGEPLRPATYEPMLLGICKAALASDSFLSAASFQETAKVLTDAAIKGKIDPLIGLKENVIIGNLVPSGTGMKNNYLDWEEGDGQHATIREAFEAQLAEEAAREDDDAQPQEPETQE